MDASGISDSTRGQHSAAACVRCGGTSQVGRGLCLSCLLQRGFDTDVESAETLDAVLAEVDVRVGSWRLGNYEVLEEIGRGGMGVIYRARQRYSGRIVAVKRLQGYHADSRETLARFRQEAQAAASLDHPNILPIYEVSESEDGVPFFSMKLATGGSLAAAASAQKHEPQQCVAVVAKVTRAVQYAHGKGILHRDLKPGNILLDARGEPLVSDFGLAKWLNITSNLTHSLTIFGTPGYIAPEQASDSAALASPAADIYSLGAILFDLLAGRPPFLGSHAISVIRQAAEKPAPKLRSLCDVTDRDLETICARCLEREPSARYHSAQDLADDLERWLEGRPIIARPVSTPTRAWRWSKRNPRLALSFAAIAFLGAGGLAATIVGSRLSSIVQQAEMARHSIVITPFEDLDEVSATSYSARSSTRAFAAAMKAAKGIQVSSADEQSTKGETDPSRPEDWKRIGEAAGARMVLTGSVRKREGKQRVTFHLVETSTGSIVDTWLRDAESISDIARASAIEVSEILERSEAHTDDAKAIGGTNNLSARSYYERGKEFFFRYNLADQVRAIDSFRTAVKIDPNYAQAQAMLASACQARSVIDPEGKWLEQAETATATALRLAPMLPESHRAHAGNLRIKGFLQASLDSYLTAYELDPSNARAAATLGNVCDFLGRPDLAISWFEKTTRREPRPFYADNLGDAWMDLVDYAEAEKAYQTAAVFRPDLPTGVLGLSRLALFRGDYETARRQCEDARAKYKDNPQPLIMAALVEFFSRHFDAAGQLYGEALASDRTGGVEFVGSVRFLSAIGFIQKRSTARAMEGRALLEDARTLDKKQLSSAPENSARLYSLAADEAALDHVAAAIASLNKAIAAGWIDYRSMELDPRFDSVRDSGMFQEILDRLKQKIQTMRRRVKS